MRKLMFREDNGLSRSHSAAVTERELDPRTAQSYTLPTALPLILMGMTQQAQWRERCTGARPSRLSSVPT